MGDSGKWVVSAAAAGLALASFGAPALAETVDIVCDVERHFTSNGRPSDNRLVSQWRLSVDTEAPSVSLIGITGSGGSPLGETWLIGAPAPTSRRGDGTVVACVIQSGRCEEPLHAASFEQDTLPLELRSDLSSMSLLSAVLFSNGRTLEAEWRGPCRRA